MRQFNCEDNTTYVPGQKKITPTGTIEITENGIVDVTQYANADVNVSGGASNVVRGEFLTSTWNETIYIPYDGNGFPIIASFWVKGGLKNADGQAAWNNSTAQRVFGAWTMVKDNMNSPKWGSTDDDKATVFCAAKYSDTALAAYISESADVFKTADASSGSIACVHFASNKQIKTLSSPYNGYWFLRDVEYEYVIVYSE